MIEKNPKVKLRADLDSTLEMREIVALDLACQGISCSPLASKTTSETDMDWCIYDRICLSINSSKAQNFEANFNTTFEGL